MSETNYLSIFDEQVAKEKWSFQQKALAASIFLICGVPLLLLLLIIISGGPR